MPDSLSEIFESVCPDSSEEAGLPSETVRFITNKQYLESLKNVVSAAKDQIQITMLEFLSGSVPDSIVSALVDAKNRGVSIRILLDKDVKKNSNRVTELQNAGIEAKLTGSSKTLHVKLVVVDKTVALVGSTNFSTSSLVYNNEANWLFSDSGLGSVFSEYSDSLWSSDSEFSKISKNPVQWITLIGDAQYADIAVPVIESSKARIRLIMYQMTYENDSKSPCDKLINALINADKKGVDVKVILEKSSFDSNLNASNTNAKTKLVSGGVEVRFDTVETTTHAKLLVVDDAVIVYSGNWIYSGLTKNHEAGAMVNSPEFSEQAESYFNNIWNVLE